MPEKKIENCPPKDSIIPDNFKAFRLILNNPAQSSDFLSYSELEPDRDWGEIACSASALSINNKLEGIKKLKKIAKFKDKETFIAEINLNKTAGIIHNDKGSHYNWWPSSSLDRLTVICQVLN